MSKLASGYNFKLDSEIKFELESWKSDDTMLGNVMDEKREKFLN